MTGGNYLPEGEKNRMRTPDRSMVNEVNEVALMTERVNGSDKYTLLEFNVLYQS
jgi:hypothetical protein